MQQIPLHVQLTADATFENFVVGDNTQLIQHLKSLSQAHEFHYIYGRTGSGSSHILQALNHYLASNAPHLMVAYLPLDNPMLEPELLEGFSAFDVVCLDNIDSCLGRSEWEEALFNLYNILKENNKSLVIAGQTNPQNISTTLADLKSRLSAMMISKVQTLSDDELILMLQAKSNAKGMELSEETGRFIVARYDRDTHALVELLERLDSASLQAKRRLTIPFVKAFLEQ